MMARVTFDIDTVQALADWIENQHQGFRTAQECDRQQALVDLLRRDADAAIDEQVEMDDTLSRALDDAEWNR